MDKKSASNEMKQGNDSSGANDGRSSDGDTGTSRSPPTSSASSQKRVPPSRRRVELLDKETLAKRRADNRRHAAASRKRRKDTVEYLTTRIRQLQEEVGAERETQRLLTQQIYLAGQKRDRLRVQSLTGMPYSALNNALLERTALSENLLGGVPNDSSGMATLSDQRSVPGQASPAGFSSLPNHSAFHETLPPYHRQGFPKDYSTQQQRPSHLHLDPLQNQSEITRQEITAASILSQHHANATGGVASLPPQLPQSDSLMAALLRRSQQPVRDGTFSSGVATLPDYQDANTTDPRFRARNNYSTNPHDALLAQLLAEGSSSYYDVGTSSSSRVGEARMATVPVPQAATLPNAALQAAVEPTTTTQLVRQGSRGEAAALHQLGSAPLSARLTGPTSLELLAQHELLTQQAVQLLQPLPEQQQQQVGLGGIRIDSANETSPENVGGEERVLFGVDPVDGISRWHGADNDNEGES